MSIGEKLETKVVVGAIKDNIDKISKKRYLMLNMIRQSKPINTNLIMF